MTGQPIALDQAVDVALADIQDLRHLGAVTGVFVELHLEVLGLELFHGRVVVETDADFGLTGAGAEGEVLWADGVGVAGQDDGPLDHVAQLAHVARPVVGDQAADGVVGDPLVDAPREVVVLYEVGDQVGDVVASFA